MVVGKKLLLPLQVMGLTLEDTPIKVPFYDCRYMLFKLTVADEAIFNASLNTETG